MLVEREETFAQLHDLLIESAQRKGVIAVIGGSTAMGKTAMLEALTERATAAGALVLAAACSRDEQQLPYAVLGQLFHGVEPALKEIGGLGGPVPPATISANPGPGQVDERLLRAAQEAHEIVGDLTTRHNVLIAVDDVQHADIPSLWCLHYLVHRLTSASLALVFTRGVQPGQTAPPILHDLLYQPNARRFHLGPLTRDGVRRMAGTGTTAGTISPALITEIQDLSGGNPLLVQALLDEHRLAGAPEATGPGWPAAAGSPVAHVFHEAVLVCVHRLGPSAVRLARSIALLDGAGTTLQLSRLSGIDAELVERFVRTLTDAGILRGPRFRRESAQRAVLDAMPLDEGSELRHRAARMLYEDGAPPATIAVHLLNAAPLREEWVQAVLRDATMEALVDNEMAQVVRFLELAGECCVTEAQRMSVKAQLTGMQWQLRPADSGQHFLSMKAPILDGRLGGAEALHMSQGMLFHLQVDEALEVIDHLNVPGDNDQSELALELRSTRLLLATEFPGLLDRPRRPLPVTLGSATTTSVLRTSFALSTVLKRGADEYAVALAEQVLQNCEMRPPTSIKAYLAALDTLVYSDRLDTAADWCERLLNEVVGHQAPAWRAVVESISALVALRRGRLAEAAEQASTALSVLYSPKPNVCGIMAHAVLIEAYTAMGDHQAAARHLAPEAPPALFQTRSGLHYLCARGRHHLATGNRSMALSDFMECGRLMRGWRMDNAALVPWRLGAAEAWLALGDRDQATRLIEEEIAKPDTGLVRSRAMARHALSWVRPAAQRPAILGDALKTLEACGARYEVARVLTDLSEAYQELGDRARARTTGRRAWRIAKSCQAEVLCEALLPTYSPGPSERAPRTDCSTLATLSGSERRVALQAAQGYTNREIAAKLFITVSTVEQHLTRVYRKMGIRSREQLLTELDIDSSEAV